MNAFYGSTDGVRRQGGDTLQPCICGPGDRASPTLRRRIALGVLGSILLSGLVGCTSFLEQVAIQVGVRHMSDEIHSIAEDYVAMEPTRLTLPQFSLNEDESTLTYQPPGLDLRALRADEDPFNWHLQEQIRIEALRRLFQSIVPRESFWVEPLRDAEAVVERAVAEAIEVEESEPGFQVDRWDRRIGRAHVQLEDSMRAYADREGYELRVLAPTVPVFRGATGFAVQITTEPDGGKVEALPFLEFRIEQARGTPLEDMEWNTLRPEETLIGVYQFRVVWSGDSGGCALDRIEIDSAQPIELVPDSTC